MFVFIFIINLKIKKELNIYQFRILTDFYLRTLDFMPLDSEPTTFDQKPEDSNTPIWLRKSFKELCKAYDSSK